MKPVSGNIGGEIEIIVQDKHGKTIKHLKKPMDSFVRNFMNYIHFADPGYWTCFDRNGTGVTFQSVSSGDNYLHSVYILASEGEDEYGILVGSSDVAFDPTQYDLDSPITHGTGAGQLEYGAMSVVDVGDEYKTWQRAFDNSSGADVVVKEIGIAVKANRYEGGSVVAYYILLARDVITSTTVPNGGRLIVKYTFRINPA